MKLAQYFGLRVGGILLQIFAISVILFTFYAASNYNVGAAHFGLFGPEAVQFENERLGTNYTYTQQFFNFWKNAIAGQCTDLDASFFLSDCGRSMGLGWEGITYLQNIGPVVWKTFINSVIIFLISFVIYASFGITLGVISSVKGGKMDQTLNFTTNALIGVPNVLLVVFLFRLVLNNTIFGFNLRDLIRVVGWGNYRVNYIESFDNTIYLFIPAIIHAFISIPFVYRYTREVVYNEKKAKYLVTARSKGLSERKVITRHMMPNIYPKLVNVLATTIPLNISSLLFIEFVFQYNGIFNYMLRSVMSYDFPVLHAGTLLISTFTSILIIMLNVIGSTLSKDKSMLEIH